jgi:hypothetical protein
MRWKDIFINSKKCDEKTSPSLRIASFKFFWLTTTSRKPYPRYAFIGLFIKILVQTLNGHWEEAKKSTEKQNTEREVVTWWLGWADLIQHNTQSIQQKRVNLTVMQSFQLSSHKILRHYVFTFWNKLWESLFTPKIGLLVARTAWLLGADRFFWFGVCGVCCSVPECTVAGIAAKRGVFELPSVCNNVSRFRKVFIGKFGEHKEV